MKDRTVDVSVVIPVYNEETNVSLIIPELKDALHGLGKNYEIIFVNDGSSDKTEEILESAAEQHKDIRLITLRRNFGQTAAMSAGFDAAVGDVIIPMDGDLQNDPADIPKLLQKIDEGYDVVSGWRVNRKDKYWTRRLPSNLANKLISLTTNVHLHDYGCTLKAYKRIVLQSIELYGEMHRFIPALASVIGVKVAEVPVNHRARTHGNSKYGISRTLRVVLDLMTVKFLLSYSTRPIQIFGLSGIISMLFSIFMGLGVIYWRIRYDMVIANNSFFLLAVLFFLIGGQFIAMGLLGEVIVRTYHEAQGKPTYVISRTRNLSQGPFPDDAGDL
ncbi:glycosyltransferase [candidate division KSB3 bacterium]|uniref:Glycosyltransferase n=1 Tax=candidate division KSB3 bacterium TaxID=2044937 RepID=A0A2G6E667_9BACT|nr:MAG: glycosyltransferase [candidate division KSB3 bacterium]PIE29958.1 MAG: glycosyltransferase [candidate division KSB3 bacterium]